MPRVRFKATEALRTWRHRPGKLVLTSYAGGKPYRRPIEPIVLHNGDVQDMTPDEAEWATVHYPDNFKLVDDEDELEPGSSAEP